MAVDPAEHEKLKFQLQANAQLQRDYERLKAILFRRTATGAGPTELTPPLSSPVPNPSNLTPIEKGSLLARFLTPPHSGSLKLTQTKYIELGKVRVLRNSTCDNK